MIFCFICFSTTERTLLLKKAKEEATGEVEAYKNEREKQFKTLEQQVKTL
jgi:hypothetical protein